MDGWIKIVATWEEMNHQKNNPHKSQFIKSILSDYTIIFSSEEYWNMLSDQLQLSHPLRAEWHHCKLSAQAQNGSYFPKWIEFEKRSTGNLFTAHCMLCSSEQNWLWPVVWPSLGRNVKEWQ